MKLGKLYGTIRTHFSRVCRKKSRTRSSGNYVLIGVAQQVLAMDKRIFLRMTWQISCIFDGIRLIKSVRSGTSGD